MGDGQLSNAVDDVAREHVGGRRCGVRVDGWFDGDDHGRRVPVGRDLKDVAVSLFGDSVAVGIDVETAGRDRKAVDDDPTFVDRSSAERLKASEVECQVDMSHRLPCADRRPSHRRIICHSVVGHRVFVFLESSSAIGAAVVCAGSAPEAAAATDSSPSLLQAAAVNRTVTASANSRRSRELRRGMNGELCVFMSSETTYVGGGTPTNEVVNGLVRTALAVASLPPGHNLARVRLRMDIRPDPACAAVSAYILLMSYVRRACVLCALTLLVACGGAASTSDSLASATQTTDEPSAPEPNGHNRSTRRKRT